MADLAAVESRTSRLYRIAELIGRYRAVNAGAWRVVDLEKSESLPNVYADESTARAGARLAAACDIHALFDEPAGR